MNKKQKKYRLDANINLPLVLSFGYNHFEEGNYLGWHDHEGYELTFVTKGSVIWELEDGSTHHVLSNQVSLMAPHVSHRGLENVTLPCDMFWMVFQPLAEKSHVNTPFSQASLAAMNQIFYERGNGVSDITPYMSATLHALHDECALYHTSQDKTFILPSLHGMICQIILQSARCFSTIKSRNLSDDYMKSHEYIKQHYMEDIRVEDIANILGKKQTYVYHLFKINTGQTPSEYIQRYRIKQAIKHLKETKASMTYIAFEVGFSSSQYFTKVFKRYMGVSPSVFRKQVQEKH